MMHRGARERRRKQRHGRFVILDAECGQAGGEGATASGAEDGRQHEELESTLLGFEKIERCSSLSAEGVLREISKAVRRRNPSATAAAATGAAGGRSSRSESPSSSGQIFMLRWPMFLEDVLRSFGGDQDVWEQLERDVRRQKTRVVRAADGGRARTVRSAKQLEAELEAANVPREQRATIAALCTQAALALPWTMLMATAPEGYAPRMSDGDACDSSAARVKVVLGGDGPDHPTSVVLRKRFALQNPCPSTPSSASSTSSSSRPASSWTIGDSPSWSRSGEAYPAEPAEDPDEDKEPEQKEDENNNAGGEDEEADVEADWVEEAVVRVCIEPFNPRADVLVWIQWQPHDVCKLV